MFFMQTKTGPVDGTAVGASEEITVVTGRALLRARSTEPPLRTCLTLRAEIDWVFPREEMRRVQIVGKSGISKSTRRDVIP